mgnify:CR=1 FL=1|tara:strand:- start:803 stop:1249 length:447 start_codon:yes stop_codon:yes gene_type:complete
MRLQEQINNDIKQAMKAKNPEKLAALRAIKASIMLEANKDGNLVVSDNVALKLIARLVKQRKDSAAIFIAQDRKDLADDEISQLSYLQEYLPIQMPDEEVRRNVKEVIAQVGASAPSDIGKCMGLLISKLNGKTDNALISRLLREELS